MGILGFLKTIAPAIIFYIGLIVVIVLSLKGSIDKALLFLIPLFPLQNVIEKLHQFPLGNQFIDIILIAMVLGWFLKAQSNRALLLTPTPLNKLLIIMCIYTYFLLWTGSSFLNLPAPLSFMDERLQAWKNYMIFSLLYIIVVNNIENAKQIKQVVLIMILSMLIMEYYTINQVHLTSGIVSRMKIEGTFVWTGVNAVAAFFSTYTFVLIGLLLFNKSKISSLGLLIVIILNIYCVLFLFSRGAYLAVLAGVIVIIFLSKRIVLVFLLVIMLLIGRSIIPATVIERINETWNDEGSLDRSSETRLELCKESFEYFKKHPLI